MVFFRFRDIASSRASVKPIAVEASKRVAPDNRKPSTRRRQLADREKEDGMSRRLRYDIRDVVLLFFLTQEA